MTKPEMTLEEAVRIIKGQKFAVASHRLIAEDVLLSLAETYLKMEGGCPKGMTRVDDNMNEWGRGYKCGSNDRRQEMLLWVIKSLPTDGDIYQCMSNAWSIESGTTRNERFVKVAEKLRTLLLESLGGEKE